MANMHDTEGATLPPDNEGGTVFDLTLMGGHGEQETWLSLNIPMFFSVPCDDGEDHDYSSLGILSVDLRDVLEEYVNLDHMQEDEGKSLAPLEGLLREYADKIATARRNLQPAT